VKLRRTTRDLLAIAVVALICGALSASPLFDFAHGLSLDVLTALRWQMFGVRVDPAASSAVVIAIDDESYQTSPLKDSPTITWTGEIGRVLTAVLDGGAKVVGFDIVVPTSLEQSEIPFGDGVLGDRFAVSTAISCARWPRARSPARSCSANSFAATHRSCRRRGNGSPFASSRISGRSTHLPMATTSSGGCR
jgi:hypothetical protein